MTRREKVLATTLLALMAVLGGGVFFHMFIYQPISEVREARDREQQELTEVQNKLAQEQRQIDEILRIDPRLSQWQKISLSPNDPELKKKPGISPEEKKQRHLRQLQVAYDRYLSELLSKHGLREPIITPRQPDRRSSPVLKAKEPVYERLAFGVSCKGKLDAVVAALKEFYTTPLLHQVRGLTLSLAPTRGRTGAGPATPSGVLDLNMNVEALLVNGAEERTTLLPEKTFPPRVLAEPARSYDLMAKRNMFTGIAPVVRPVRKNVEDKNEVLRFVKLTMLSYNADRRRWEGTLYDQGKGGAEIKVAERLYTDITINDKGQVPVLEAKVVKMDDTQLIFQSEGKYYRLRCGDFIYPAIRTPLKSSELMELGLASAP
jgi:hypothetical protein